MHSSPTLEKNLLRLTTQLAESKGRIAVLECYATTGAPNLTMVLAAAHETIMPCLTQKER